MNNDTFLTDAKVAEKLWVSRRTLHEYCDHGLILSYAIGSKYIYSERDNSYVLMANYRSIED